MKCPPILVGVAFLSSVSFTSVTSGGNVHSSTARQVAHSPTKNLIRHDCKNCTNKPGDVSKGKERICYDALGCFVPGPGPLRRKLLPKRPEKIGAAVLLFTPETPDDYEILDWTSPSSLWKSKFDPSRRAVIFFHGYRGSAKKPSSLAVKNAFLQAEPVNFLAIDWTAGASELLYAQAAANSEVAGRQVALLMATMMDVMNYDHTKFYLVGFSLGAHIAGFTADYFKVLKPGYLIPRITGLDPSGYEFYDGDYPNETRLDASDADYVDVIHTNGGHFVTGHLSSLAQMGHIDYYPNGGARQPGCSVPSISVIESQFMPRCRSQGLCNHARAWEYFVASLLHRECEFVSIPCGNDYDETEAKGRAEATFRTARAEFSSGRCFHCSPAVSSNGTTPEPSKACGKMGYKSIETPARGKHFLVTSDREPYCGNMLSVTFSSSILQQSSQLGRTRGQILLTLSQEVQGRMSTVGPRPVFRNNSTSFTAGKSATTIVLVDDPGWNLAEAKVMLGVLEYLPAGFGSVPKWEFEFVEIADYKGNRFSGRIGAVQGKKPVDVFLMRNIHPAPSFIDLLPDLAIRSHLSALIW